MLDFFNSMDVKRGMSPVAAITDNTPFVSQIVDMRDTQGAAFLIATGSLADAGATFTVLVETGNDAALADAVAAPDDQLLGTEVLATFDQTADDHVFKIGVRSGYRNYARVTITPAGNAANAFINGIWVRFPTLRPANNPPV